MRRLVRVYAASVRACIVRELEFRANFLAKFAQNIGWVGFYLIIIEVIYQNVSSVAGWDRSAGLILGGTAVFVAGVHGLLFGALRDVPEQVRKGTLDFVLTRPMDTQFSVSLRLFDFGRTGAAISGVIMVGYGVSHLSHVPSASDLAAYAVLTICSAAIFYCLNLFLATLAIFFVRTDNIWVIGELVLDSSRYTTDIFPAFGRFIATYVLPLGLISTLPSRALVFGGSVAELLQGLLYAGVGVAATRLFWRRALYRYSGASS